MTENVFITEPISNVVWMKRDLLFSNTYNPNKVAPPELKLLKESILKSGWTQPIVIKDDKEIIDGFHRWTVSGDKEVSKMTDGYVPTVTIREIDKDEQMMATIRHNRARGSHGVKPMAVIMQKLKDEHKLDNKALNKLLGMEDEEIRRLYEAGSIELIKELAESGNTGKNAEHIKKFKENNDFSPSWE